MQTPSISIRSYSTDQYYLDKILYANFFRLKKIESPNKVVVDVGAHCGYFTLACIAAGYAKSYALEPFSENYKMLIHNADIFGEAFVPYQIAVAPENSFTRLVAPVISESKFLDYGNLTTSSTEGNMVIALSVASALKSLVIEDSVELMKLNVGYAFDFVTGNEAAFSKVNNLVFEMPYSPNELRYMKGKLQELGFKDALVIDLTEKGKHFGFLGFFSKNSLDDVFDVTDLKSKNYETQP